MRFVIPLVAASLLTLTACEDQGAAAPAEGEKKEAAEAEPAAEKAAVVNPMVGEPAPAFTLKDASGKEHKLANYKGKTVVLEWTEESCPFVKRHYASGTMQKLAKRYADQDVVWLAVNSSHFVKADKTQAWKKENGISYPVLLDAAGEAGKAYGAKTTPHMFVIDKEGVVQYAGAIDDDPRGEKEEPVNYVDEALTSVLKGEAPSVQATKPYGCSVKYQS